MFLNFQEKRKKWLIIDCLKEEVCVALYAPYITCLLYGITFEMKPPSYLFLKNKKRKNIKFHSPIVWFSISRDYLNHDAHDHALKKSKTLKTSNTLQLQWHLKWMPQISYVYHRCKRICPVDSETLPAAHVGLSCTEYNCFSRIIKGWDSW